MERSDMLGGMVTGGLACSDTGNASAIGGIARELFVRIGGIYDLPRGTAAYKIEAGVAATVFGEMLADAGVRDIRTGYRLLSAAKFERPPATSGGGDGGISGGGGAAIRSLTAVAPGPSPGVPTTFTAAVFIDASYEGDLMAMAGVDYTYGREPPAQYGEPFAGVRRQPEPLCPLVVQFDVPVYVHVDLGPQSFYPRAWRSPRERLPAAC